MTKSRTKKMLALLAVGAVMTTAAAGIAFSRNTTSVFASTDAVTEVTGPEGSATNPVAAKLGVNTIEKMVVSENPEMGFKELVYYMTYTPADSGVYKFTHTNTDVTVADIYSDTDTPYGEWNDDWSVYTIELTADVEYTILVNNYDWLINLDEYAADSYYTLSAPANIAISYEGAAAGSSYENALEYTLGDTIYVSQGHAPVWYSFTGTGANYYLISYSGNAVAYEEFIGDLYELANANSGVGDFKSSDVVYICVTPSESADAEVQILNKDTQTDGSCIVRAVNLPADGVVGGDNWYKYTVGANDVTISLTPTDDAYTVVTEYKDDEGKVVFRDEYTLVGTVNVYEGYAFAGTLYDGASLTLKAGTTYHFFAPNYEYTKEDGTVINVQSKLVIG